MKLVIEITTDNAAFSDGALGSECARILGKIGDRLERESFTPPDDTFRLLDYNGNAVGSARWVDA